MDPIEEYLNGLNWSYELGLDDVYAVPFAVQQADESTVEAQLLIRLGGEEDRHGLALTLRPAQRLRREQWTVALWLANSWNAHSPVIRARLDVADPSRDTAAPLVLEGWWPLDPDVSPGRVQLVLDRMLRDALAFWTSDRVPPSA